jgi:hypothetical protein
MTTQNYLIIENNVVTNVCLWDENTQTWTPPNDATMLIQAVTSSMIWEAVYTNNKLTDWNLVEQIGAGQIGFTWNGTVLTTNEPKPSIAE